MLCFLCIGKCCTCRCDRGRHLFAAEPCERPGIEVAAEQPAGVRLIECAVAACRYDNTAIPDGLPERFRKCRGDETFGRAVPGDLRPEVFEQRIVIDSSNEELTGRDIQQ